MKVTSAQFRMARAALAWTVRDLAERSGVHRNTIVRIESGEASHGPTINAVRLALESGGVVFLPSAEGVHDGAVALRWGFDPARPDATTSAAKGETQGEGGQSAAWDWEGDAPALERIRDAAPVDLSEEDREALVEHYRQRPEAWAALHEVSRLALLRAMGLERLG